MAITLEYIVFGWLYLFATCWFLALNWVSIGTYAAIISSRKPALIPFLLAAFWHLISLIPLAIAILSHSRMGASIPIP